MEAEKTCQCGMPLSEETWCNCNHDLCKHCCECDPGCSCNCAAVEDEAIGDDEEEV